MDGRRAHPTSSSQAPERRPTEDRRDWCRLQASAVTTDNRIPDAGGDIPRGRVRSAPGGDSPRVRGQDSRPRRRRTPPPAQDCPRPRGNVPGRAEYIRPRRGPDHEQSTRTGRPARHASGGRHTLFPTTTGRPSAQTSGPAPQVRGRRSKRTGPGPVLDACLG